MLNYEESQILIIFSFLKAMNCFQFFISVQDKVNSLHNLLVNCADISKLMNDLFNQAKINYLTRFVGILTAPTQHSEVTPSSCNTLKR